MILLIILLVNFAVSADLNTAEAAKHVGESGTVCGTVVDVHTASRSNGSPTFINLDKSYPNQVFTILIWGSDMSKFSPARSAWNGKTACATGKIELYRGKPEIVAHDAGQVSFPK